MLLIPPNMFSLSTHVLGLIPSLGFVPHNRPEISGLMPKWVTSKAISIKPLFMSRRWSCCEVVICLRSKQSSSAIGCNMSKVMTNKTFNILITSIVRRKWFPLKIFFLWLLDWLIVHFFIWFFRICFGSFIVACTRLWARFYFFIFNKSNTIFDGGRPLIAKDIVQYFELSWNLNCLSFSTNLPSRILTSTFFSHLVFSNWVLNLMISFLNPFSCSLNTLRVSSYRFFVFSRSNLREMIYVSIPSQ